MRVVMWIHCPDTGFMITMPQGHRNMEYVGPFLVPEPYQAGDCPPNLWSVFKNPDDEICNRYTIKDIYESISL